MASQDPARAPRPPRTRSPAHFIKYDVIYQDRTRADKPVDSEPPLGPYEIRYLVDMGYAAPARSDN